jgi:hypothetical protein
MDQIQVSFSQVLNQFKNMPAFKVVAQGKSYFTVEDKDGYRAYFQVNKFGHEDRPEYYINYSISTVHKPNKLTGSGREFQTLPANSSEYLITTSIIAAIIQSKRDIESGRERMDTRVASKCGKYLLEKGNK